MKKILLYMLVLLLCFSCEKEEKYAIITVTTSVSDITESSATLIWTVNIEKGKDADDISIDGKGFYYRRQGNEWKKFELSPNDDFSANYTELASLTTYEVQAYAKIGENEVKGNIVTFTTKTASTTAQVRFKKEKAYTYMTYVDVSEFTAPYTRLAWYEFGTGMEYSPLYKEIPAGNHTLWCYSTYLVNGEEEGYRNVPPYTYNFQAGQKYTIVFYVDETTNDYAANIINDTFSSSDLRSTTPTFGIKIPENSLKVQEGRGRVSVDNE